MLRARTEAASAPTATRVRNPSPTEPMTRMLKSRCARTCRRSPPPASAGKGLKFGVVDVVEGFQELHKGGRRVASDRGADFRPPDDISGFRRAERGLQCRSHLGQ